MSVRSVVCFYSITRGSREAQAKAGIGNYDCQSMATDNHAALYKNRLFVAAIYVASEYERPGSNE